ncbi:MAG: N-acetylglucosamine-6-phosphate deacetylase [Chloroflexota bacterium]|nr:N-acetylglucosamine-6-phosphate deacetylase [Chloroflexota bacterium]
MSDTASGAARGAVRVALTNGRIALPDRLVMGQAVVIEGDTILGLAAADDLGDEIERLDVGGRLIAPGLIDIHTHGALGHSFNERDVAAWTTILRENARRGVTSLVATIAPEPIPDLTRCFDFCRAWLAKPRPGARVLGAHLESPYVSPAQKGALDPSAMRTPDDGSVDALLDYADVLRIFVLAPELPGALALVARLNALGIIPAAGHSSAKDEQVAAAMRAGLRHVTHIWSAMSSVVREGPWRKPGVLEAALVFDGLTVEMIADNRHLPATLMKLAYKCIGPDRLSIVSDATNGAGLPAGTRYRMGSMEYVVGDGVGMMFDNTAFAGSATLLNQMIPVLRDVVGVPLIEAIRMTTLNPARVLGLDMTLGSIAPGKRADLVIFEDDFSAWRVMIGGRWANERINE